MSIIYIIIPAFSNDDFNGDDDFKDDDAILSIDIKLSLEELVALSALIKLMSLSLFKFYHTVQMSWIHNLYLVNSTIIFL